MCNGIGHFIGVVAGAVIGSLLFVALIVILVILYVRKKNPPWAIKITDTVSDIDWKKPVHFFKRYVKINNFQ